MFSWRLPIARSLFFLFAGLKVGCMGSRVLVLVSSQERYGQRCRRRMHHRRRAGGQGRPTSCPRGMRRLRGVQRCDRLLPEDAVGVELILSGKSLGEALRDSKHITTFNLREAAESDPFYEHFVRSGLNYHISLIYNHPSKLRSFFYLQWCLVVLSVLSTTSLKQILQ